MLDAIQRTGDAKWPLIPRLLAGLPLAMFGLMHLVQAAPVAPLVRAAGLPMPEAAGVAAPIVEVVAGLLLIFGWFTRVGGVLGALAMAGAITVHFLVPDDQWPQPASGTPGPEPLWTFLLAWVILGCSIIATIRGGGFWSMDRRQLATRASSRGWGMDGPAPAPPKTVKTKPTRSGTIRHGTIEPVKDGESVW